MTQEASDEEMAEVVVGCYKSNCFSKNACVSVSNGGRALDRGGIRRQLYSAAFQAVAAGHLQIFDTPSERLRPRIKTH